MGVCCFWVRGKFYICGGSVGVWKRPQVPFFGGMLTTCLCWCIYAHPGIGVMLLVVVDGVGSE